MTVIRTTWKLRDGMEVFAVPVGNGRIAIRISWSPKLGLEHKQTVDSFSKATELVQKIAGKGVVDTTHWNKEYHPTKRWLAKP